MKKTLLILVAVSTIFATACGDDSKSRESGEEDSKDCGSITDVGLCEGAVLKYCEDGELKVSDCAAGNKVCGLDSKGMYDCIVSSNPGDQGGGKGCGSVTEKGLCEGDVLKYCEDGELRVSNCASGNKVCGLASDNRYDCIESSGQGQTGGCGDITDVGVCNGNVLKFCNSNRVETVDCSKRSDDKKTCGMNVDSKKNDCIAPSGSSSDACSKLGDSGLCVDGSVKWCSDGKIETASCTSFDLGCVYDDKDRATCMSTCGDVDAAGTCDASILKYCAGATKEDGKTKVNVLYTYDCATDSKTCGKDKNGNYNCI